MAPNKKSVTSADFTERAQHQTAVNNAKNEAAKKADCGKSGFIDHMDPKGALRRARAYNLQQQRKQQRKQQNQLSESSVNSDSSSSSSST